MNVQKFWTSAVEKIVITGRCTHAQAWHAAAKLHPDAAILMRATGQTRQMIQFFNSKLPSDPKRNEVERREFANAVDSHMQEASVPYDMAFKHVSNKRPQFLNSVKITMPGKKPQNSTPDTNGANGVPAATSQFKALFRLPPSTTDAEWAAAWAGNHNAPSPVNFGRVFDSLCELAQNQTSADYETALRTTKARFPDLWSAVDQLSQMTKMS